MGLLKSAGYLSDGLLKSGDLSLWCIQHKVQIKSIKELAAHDKHCFYEIAIIEDSDRLPLKGLR